MAKKTKTGDKAKKDKTDPKAAAVEHMKESLARIQAARAASSEAGTPGAERGGKGPKPNTPKGRIFRHQGR